MLNFGGVTGQQSAHKHRQFYSVASQQEVKEQEKGGQIFIVDILFVNKKDLPPLFLWVEVAGKTAPGIPLEAFNFLTAANLF